MSRSIRQRIVSRSALPARRTTRCFSAPRTRPQSRSRRRGWCSFETPSVADLERHAIAVLVDNEPGVLARVIGLFSGRGYNIESLTVAEVDRANQLSRITIVTTGTRMIIEQIKAQLSRLVPVHKVHDLTDEGPFVEREMALIKVAGKGETRIESLRLADIFRARVVDSTTESFVFEMTGSSEKLNAFITLMEPLGLVEVSRTGAVAISRGPAQFE